MGKMRPDRLTTRRGLLGRDAALAGVAAFPIGGASAVETATARPHAPLRLAAAGAPTTTAQSGVTIKSTRLAGSAINYAYAVKAGPWVFLNGHEAFDFEKDWPRKWKGRPAID
jgi:hypothetical protein